MPNSQNLRAIGQSMEMAHIDAFELEKHGQFYVVRSNFITPYCRSIVKNSLFEKFRDDLEGDTKAFSDSAGEGHLRYDSRMISCLNGQGQKRRRHYLPPSAQPARRPSQYLRTLGEHLDRAEARTFLISWDYPKSVSVTYLTPDGHNEERTFSFDKLHELGFHMRFRRSRAV